VIGNSSPLAGAFTTVTAGKMVITGGASTTLLSAVITDNDTDLKIGGSGSGTNKNIKIYSDGFGTLVGTFSSTALTLGVAISLAGGTSGTGYSFSGSAPATSLTLDASGLLGIGAGGVPAVKLDVQGASNLSTNWIWAGGNVANPPAGCTYGVLLGRNLSNGNSEANIVWGQGIGSGQFLGFGKWTGSAYTEQMRLSSDGTFRVKGAGTAGSTDAFQVSGTAPADAARIDSSGNLGVGTTSPTSKLTVAALRTTSSGEFLGGINALDTTTGGAAGVGGVITLSGDTQGAGYKQFAAILGGKENSTVTDRAGFAAFYTRLGGGDLTERARIDSSGNLLVGKTTTAIATVGFRVEGTAGRFVTSLVTAGFNQINHTSGAGTETAIEFLRSSSTIGSITTTTVATSYNTTSDQRLKENIVDAPEFGSVIDSLQVRSFDWKSGNLHQRAGFIAQELVTVAPEAVHQPTDPEAMMAVDYSKLVPMLVKELQSLRARVAQLESKA